jgi:CheY-like chemotaxis protein
VGSTFTLELVLAKAMSEPHSLPTEVPLSGLRVVLIDGDPTSSQAVAEHLRSWGCRPVEAPSVPVALALLKESVNSEPFQLMIVDSSIPDWEKRDLTESLEADPRLLAVSRVLLSSFQVATEVRGDWSRFFRTSLIKPVQSEPLLNAVVKSLERRPRVEQGILGRTDPTKQLSLRVLLAEDHAANRMVVQRMLEMMGCKIDSVVNGREAVEAMERAAYDLVLMDIQMPVMDGLAATVAIRRNEASRGRHTPILAYTAHTMEEDHQSCLEAGMDGFVHKPILIKDLCEALARWTRPVTQGTQAGF